MSKIADVAITETPTPLASANVGNGDTPPPLEHAEVKKGNHSGNLTFEL